MLCFKRFSFPLSWRGFEVSLRTVKPVCFVLFAGSASAKDKGHGIPQYSDYYYY